MSFTHSLEPISETILGASAASITISSIPSAPYNNLFLVVTARGDSATLSTGLLVQFNADTGLNYTQGYFYAATATTNSSAVNTTQSSMQLASIAAANSTASHFSSHMLWLLGYSNTNWFKNVLGRQVGMYTNVASNSQMALVSGGWFSTAAINSIKLFPTGGNFVANTVVRLYGQA